MTYPQSTSLDGDFTLPSYFQMGGWPGPMLAVARCVAIVLCLPALVALPVRLRLESDGLVRLLRRARLSVPALPVYSLPVVPAEHRAAGYHRPHRTVLVPS